jgi:hypothetical protein
MSIVGPQRLALRGWGTADPIFLSTAQVHVPQVFVMVPSGGSGMLPLSHQKSSATADQLSYKTLKRKKKPEMPLLAIYENTPLGSLPVDKIARSARILWFWPGQNVICHNYHRYLLNPMASPKRTMRALQILYSKSDSGSVEIFKFERVQFSSYAPMLNAMHFSTLLLSALALLCVYLLLTRKFSAPLGRNEPRKYSDNKDSGDGSAA